MFISFFSCRGRDGSFGGVKRPKQEKALGVAEPEQRSTTTNTPFIPKRLAELSWFKEESPKSDAIPAERLTGEKGDWSISASLAWYGRQMEDEEELKDRWDQVLSSMNEEERKNTSYYFSLTAQTGGKCDIYGSTYLSGKTLGDVKVLEHLWNRSIKKMSAEDKKGMTPEWRMTKHAR